MCAGCGCGDLENDHGDPDNLKFSRILDAVVAAGKFQGKSITAEDYLHNLHDSIKGEEKLQTLPRAKGLRKIVRILNNDIIGIMKSSRREEKGRFIRGIDDTHSHRMNDEIVTHTHSGEKGHQ